jgi:2-hydroxychromene-2-carboxylate isomerase
VGSARASSAGRSRARLRPYPLAGATIHRLPDFYLDYSSPYAYLAAAQSYSLHPLRAALVAADAGRIREFSAEVYRLVFAAGRTLTDPAPVLEAAVAAGVDPDAVRAGLEDPAIKARLRAETDAALARGVTGVPTVVVGDALFWGDDQLEDAAAAAAAAP